MNKQVIFYVLSRMIFAEAVVLLFPMFIALYNHDHNVVSFLMASVLAGTVGIIMRSRTRIKAEKLTLKEGIAITGLAWVVTTFLGMLPYVSGGYLNGLDAVFESISGFTTTGATTFTTLEGLPQSILFWRAMTNWLGGLGIIVIFIALLPQAGASTVNMYRAEGAGPTDDRVLPRLRDMTKALFIIYISFTAAGTCLFMVGGLDLFQSLVHAMASIAGGGFSSYDDSAMHFDSVWLEGWMTALMAIAGGSFGLYYRAWHKGLHVLWRDTEFRCYVYWLGGTSLLIALVLMAELGYTPGYALRLSTFQVSSVATTGFVSTDFDLWPEFTKGILILLMIVGGCGGSTASGLKVARIIVLCKSTWNIVHQKLSPRRVTPVRLGGARVEENQVLRIGQYFFLYMACLALCTILMTWDGIGTFDSFGIAVATLGNVGPGFGVIGATQTYAGLSDFAKVTLCIFMLLGRLEILTLLVMLRPSFWREERYW